MKTIFFGAGAAWLVVGTVTSLVVGAGLPWFLGIWVLSMADLAALGKMVQVVISASQAAPENRKAHVIRAFTWGVVKLACFGLLIAVLVNAKVIPAVALLMGLATLVMVPLVGGFVWSR